LVIVLTQYEKKTFISFVSLYIGSAFLFIVIIAALFYKMEYKYGYDATISQMQIEVNKLSSKIVVEHMKGLKFDKNQYTNGAIRDDKSIYELYDKNKKPLLNTIKEKIDFDKSLYNKNNTIYLVSNSTYGHLGISYIVLKNHYFLQHNKILFKTVAIFSSIFVVMIFVGFILSKLFINPILTQRKKLDNFIKDTTHELNTPITALLMSVNKKNPITPNNIKRINLSAKRISELYTDLTYLFLEDKSNLEPISLNTKDILDENIDYFIQLAIKKHITLNIDTNDMYVKIDKESFVRLSNNLISNAIKYSKQNGTISITLKDNKFIVQDDGIGIDEDKQKKIFQRFYRATSNAGGFGVGLDIVSNICKKYDIKIDLLSKKNQGSTFILSF